MPKDANFKKLRKTRADHPALNIREPHTPSTRKMTRRMLGVTLSPRFRRREPPAPSSCSRRYAARISSTLASAFKGVGFSDASSSDREGNLGGIFCMVGIAVQPETR